MRINRKPSKILMSGALPSFLLFYQLKTFLFCRNKINLPSKTYSASTSVHCTVIILYYVIKIQIYTQKERLNKINTQKKLFLVEDTLLL